MPMTGIQTGTNWKFMLQRCLLIFRIHYKFGRPCSYSVGARQENLTGTTFLTNGRITFAGHKTFFVLVMLKL